MSLNKMKRILGAVTLVAVFSLAAVPAWAADEQAGLPGLLDRLDDWMQSMWTEMTGVPTDPLNGDGGYVDPNGGGGPRTGCETTPQGCGSSGGS